MGNHATIEEAQGRGGSAENVAGGLGYDDTCGDVAEDRFMKFFGTYYL